MIEGFSLEHFDVVTTPRSSGATSTGDLAYYWRYWQGKGGKKPTRQF